MNPTRRILIAFAAVLAIAGFVPSAGAQSVLVPPTVEGLGVVIGADDTDIPMVCRYVGYSPATTANSGTITVAVTTSDITFAAGPQGSESATAVGIECPVSGQQDGIFDVSNAACNTFGEIIDLVNVPASPFRCVLIDAMRSDVADARLLTKSATRATTVNGTAINWDTSTAFEMSAALVPPEYRTMAPYLPLGSRTLKQDVWNNTRTVALLANAVSTYGSGASQLDVYSVNVNDGSLGKSTEIVTTLYSFPAGATTVAKEFTLGSPIGIIGKKNEKVVVRLKNSAAASAANLRVNGYLQRLGPPN